MQGKRTGRKKGRIRWKRIMLLFFIIFLASVGIFTWYYANYADPPPADIEEEGEEDIDLQALGPKNPLTGLPAERYINPTAVMISNIAEARPQTGLCKANIVYEIEMEGQITRFIALFYGDPPEIAGPVRSARPYVMRFGLEWDAYFVHVGGSEDAKQMARKTEALHNIDGMSVTKGFIMDSTRKRPHNTYINFDILLEGRPETGRLPEIWFKDDDGGAPQCRTITMDYGKSNRIQYIWDDEKRSYARWLNDKPHVDRETDEQIYANNVFIQYAKHTFSGDALGHIDVHVVGSGKAEYYIGGKYQTGTWSKVDEKSPVRYYDESGREIVRVRGTTFVQVVRDNKKLIGIQEETGAV